MVGRISAVLGHVRLCFAAGDDRNADHVWEKAAGAEDVAAGTAAAGIAAVAAAGIAVAAVDRISPVEAVRHDVVAPNLVSIKTHMLAG